MLAAYSAQGDRILRCTLLAATTCPTQQFDEKQTDDEMLCDIGAHIALFDQQLPDRAGRLTKAQI